uniref:Uncharacterized protein n=1 Tax=Anguilla anguilla TaxID=7936 RepID=A0A0E9WG71_ANGAN
MQLLQQFKNSFVDMIEHNCSVNDNTFNIVYNVMHGKVPYSYHEFHNYEYENLYIRWDGSPNAFSLLDGQ